MIGGWKYKPDLFNSDNLQISSELSNTHSLGQILYTDYIHIFQIAGMILLVSMIGSIVLTLRERSKVKKQKVYDQINFDASNSIEKKKVKLGQGIDV